MFLEGRSDQVIAVLGERMEAASAALEFEQAARLRDQIAYLQKVRQQQSVAVGGGDADIIAADVLRGSGCIQVFYVRGGLNLGNKAFFPVHTEDVDRGGLLAAFLAQYYISRRPDREVPREILVNAPVPDLELLQSAISEHTGRRVSIRDAVRGERRRMLELAHNNARLALEARLSANADAQERWTALAEAFDIGDAPERIECFDISHTQGEKTVASCVVFDRDGARKSDYRRFNIRDVAAGDDYAAMRQAMERRYLRIKTESGTFPDLLLVDGGKGQVNMARELLEELQIDNLPVIGVAKGPERRPGTEVLIMHDGRTERRLPAASPALLLIQQIRDEAHRFAITGHRARRGKARQRSTLEDIEGIGGKRRAQLIRHFGGLQGVERAGVDELSKVPGISRDLARRIYERFHQQA
ncbi:MAG: excinuclease ABC subunit UvrC, partial [Gammaproteobacteria bacterium]|nr:excinuclease ABC subunit UvrC [Gammaproteobacteria bacterium]